MVLLGHAHSNVLRLHPPHLSTCTTGPLRDHRRGGLLGISRRLIVTVVAVPGRGTVGPSVVPIATRCYPACDALLVGDVVVVDRLRPEANASAVLERWLPPARPPAVTPAGVRR